MARSRRRFLVVLVHPVAESFVAALATQTVSSLQSSGHEVCLVNLYADEFDPTLSREEWCDRANARQWTSINAHTASLRWADGLVFVYPTWFGGVPAMLKGWFDRVWGEGIAYTVPADGSRVRGLLTNIRSIDVVTSHGSGKVMNSLQGEPGKRLVLRGMRSMCGLRCRSRWHAFYGNDTATASDRQAFLTHIGVVMAKK